MPVGMPRCLQAYRVLQEKPTSALMLAGRFNVHESTAHAWLRALQDCGLIFPCDTERTENGKGGLNRIVWTTRKP
jgi:predicted transcriptional regulator